MNEKDKLIDIFEQMLDEMGEGGMDTSYGGTNYSTAMERAAERILDRILGKIAWASNDDDR